MVIGHSYAVRADDTMPDFSGEEEMHSIETETSEESEPNKSCCEVFYEEEDCANINLCCCFAKKFDNNDDNDCKASSMSMQLPKISVKEDCARWSTRLCSWLLSVLAIVLVVATLPLSLCVCLKVAQEYERCVVFRLGRVRNGLAAGPGVFFVVPCIDDHVLIDLRTVAFDVPPQEVLSRDSVTVTVDAVVYYRVSEPVMATNNVEDYRRSTHLLAATTLRNVLGTKVLAEILSERESISHVMEQSLDEATDQWGVKVERVEIKDVRLPVQLQRSMAAEAEAAREARAKVIKAEGEHKASRALMEAAAIIAERPSALQLRYLQTLNAISGERNSTIIFPVPIDLLKK